MRWWIVGVALIVCVNRVSEAQPKGDQAGFELTAAALPVPAMKYGLLFNPAEQTADNAATHYRTAATLFGNEPWKILDKFDSHHYSDATYPAAAEDLYQRYQTAYAELAAAAQCEQCDWQTPIREKGLDAVLPYDLNSSRSFATFITYHVRQKVLENNAGEAIATLRIGYELGRHVGHDRTIVSPLVEVGILTLLNRELEEIMQMPGAPNLYWALAAFPRPTFSLQSAVAGHRIGFAATFKDFAGSNLDDFSGDELKLTFVKAAKRFIDNHEKSSAAEFWVNDDALNAEVQKELPAAQRHYARTRNLPLDQVEPMEPLKLAEIYWYESARDVSDHQYAISNLPYPRLIEEITESDDTVKHLRADQPANVFAEFLPMLGRWVTVAYRVDRQIAALTDVEAISASAAAHGGKLPDRLDDDFEPPLWDNPRTGRAFNYQLKDGVATLSDPEPEYPLVYTIHLRE